jgi:hypothetical protein
MSDKVDLMVKKLLEDDPETPTVDTVLPLTPEEFEQLKSATEKFKPASGSAPDGSEPVYFIDAHDAHESDEISWETFQSSSGEMYGFAVWSPTDRHAWVVKLKDQTATTRRSSPLFRRR